MLEPPKAPPKSLSYYGAKAVDGAAKDRLRVYVGGSATLGEYEGCGEGRQQKSSERLARRTAVDFHGVRVLGGAFGRNGH